MTDLFKRKPQIVVRQVMIPAKFPEIPGVPKERQVSGIMMTFGSHHVHIQSDHPELLKQVVRALDSTTLVWTEEVKLDVGEE